MMTTHQLKAARALLDWTQADLAKATRMHINVINNLERGITNPRRGTVERLQATLEMNGVEFIGTRGVALNTSAVDVRKFEGAGFVSEFLDDVLSVLKGPNDEAISAMGEIRNFDAYDQGDEKRYQTEKTARGFKERLITRDIAGFYPRNANICRVVDPQLLGNVDTVVYGDRVAYFFWKNQEIVVMKSAELAATQRKLLLDLWENGREPVRPARRQAA